MASIFPQRPINVSAAGQGAALKAAEINQQQQRTDLLGAQVAAQGLGQLGSGLSDLGQSLFGEDSFFGRRDPGRLRAKRADEAADKRHLQRQSELLQARFNLAPNVADRVVRGDLPLDTAIESGSVTGILQEQDLELKAKLQELAAKGKQTLSDQELAQFQLKLSAQAEARSAAIRQKPLDELQGMTDALTEALGEERGAVSKRLATRMEEEFGTATKEVEGLAGISISDFGKFIATTGSNSPEALELILNAIEGRIDQGEFFRKFRQLAAKGGFTVAEKRILASEKKEAGIAGRAEQKLASVEKRAAASLKLGREKLELAQKTEGRVSKDDLLRALIDVIKSKAAFERLDEFQMGSAGVKKSLRDLEALEQELETQLGLDLSPSNVIKPR